MLYDSLNPLHVEWLAHQDATAAAHSELWVDLSNELWIDLVEDLADLCNIDPTKVQTKNRPTLISKNGNHLYKISLASETETQPLHVASHAKILSKFNKKFEQKTVNTLPALADLLKT